MTSCAQISKYFSDAAGFYDARARIQRALAVELAGKVRVRPGDTVADIGTGTGRLLEALRQRYPDAVYVGVDASEGMLLRGEGSRVRADHGRLPFKRESLDILVSSSCYHWSTDLPAAFRSAAAVLKPGGKFEAVLFGRDTLGELFRALAAASSGLSARIDTMPRLPSLEDVCAAIATAGFTGFDFEREYRREDFGSIKEVLLWLRETGTSGLGRGMFIGRDVLKRAESYYLKNSNGQVSFEVIWLQAQK